MFSRIKTYAIALAMMAFTASVVAQAKSATVSTDVKSNTVKVQIIKTGAANAVSKTDKSQKLSYDPKAVLAQDKDMGIGIPLASLPRLGKYKKSELDMTKWQFMPEYEDEVFEWYKLPDGRYAMLYKETNKPATIYSVSMQERQKITPGREIMTLNIPGRSKAKVKNMGNFLPLELNPALMASGTIIPGEILAYMAPELLVHDSVSQDGKKLKPLPGMGQMFFDLWTSTGIYDIIQQTSANFSETWILGLGRVLMMLVALVLLYLAVFKEFEPLLLLPIGFGAILMNLPGADLEILHLLYEKGIANELFPLILFIGIGAMIDFGPLLSNPKLMIFGAAAQFGIFFTFFVASLCGFDIRDSASIAIIGAADGPTSIFVAQQLGSGYTAAIMVAAYSYMALVPMVQPPVIRLCTTQAERKIKMTYKGRPVSKTTKILFPIAVTVIVGLVAPQAVALIGFLMFGNLIRECGVLNSLSETAQNVLANLITILLGLTIASRMNAAEFLRVETLLILGLGLVAFVMDTVGGVMIAKLMNLFLKEKINPMIGAAGISAFPMSARVVHKMGLAEDKQNFLLMHAAGVNVSGQIASVIAGGLILALVGG